MQTKVTTDYLEVDLTGSPENDKRVWKDQNFVQENIFTGKVLDSTNPNEIGKDILFARVFKLIVSPTETKFFTHRNAVMAFETKLSDIQ